MKTKNMRKLEDEVFVLSEEELPKGLVPEVGTMAARSAVTTTAHSPDRIALLTSAARQDGKSYRIIVRGGENIAEFLEYMGVLSNANLEGKEVTIYAKDREVYALGRR